MLRRELKRAFLIYDNGNGGPGDRPRLIGTVRADGPTEARNKAAAAGLAGQKEIHTGCYSVVPVSAAGLREMRAVVRRRCRQELCLLTPAEDRLKHTRGGK